MIARIQSEFGEGVSAVTTGAYPDNSLPPQIPSGLNLIQFPVNVSLVNSTQDETLQSSRRILNLNSDNMDIEDLGIDLGVTGAGCLVMRDLTWAAFLVASIKVGDTRKMDIARNRAWLRSAVEKSGGKERIVVVYEEAGENPGFGYKNAFRNGAHEEFWRVLLTMENLRFSSVHPLRWQSQCLGKREKGMSKEKARAYAAAHLRDFERVNEYSKAEQLGIIDAMCIALWSRFSRRTAVQPSTCPL